MPAIQQGVGALETCSSTWKLLFNTSFLKNAKTTAPLLLQLSYLQGKGKSATEADLSITSVVSLFH